MKIALGADHAGYPYKERIKRFLLESGHEVEDFGTNSEDPVDYPLFIRPAAGAVAEGACERGVVLGGSGNGEAMAANRIPGVRCALCWNRETAILARRHNDANVLALGGRVIPWEDALEIVRAWLETPFDGGRHLRRIQQIDEPVPFGGGGRARSGEGPLQAAGDSKSGRQEEHDVVISFGYILYSEGKRTLELTVEPGLKHPTIVHVPSASRWDEEMPDWARGRREEILSRIRPKCVHLDCEWKEI
ncbi:MAG: ribose 5-phosphate isomerase B [Deltaproteobacteria bacterium]|nr:ribose 5-phosphate isomerase B [Deltaproteobacteria bacterium]